MDWFGKHDDPNKIVTMTAIQDPPITSAQDKPAPSAPSTPPPNNSFSSPAFAANSPIAPKTDTPSPAILSGNPQFQDEIDIIKSLPPEVPAELIVAIIDHRNEYLQAARSNTVSELLGNIKKFNPLIKSFYDHKTGSNAPTAPVIPAPQPPTASTQATPTPSAATEHPYQS